RDFADRAGGLSLPPGMPPDSDEDVPARWHAVGDNWRHPALPLGPYRSSSVPRPAVLRAPAGAPPPPNPRSLRVFGAPTSIRRQSPIPDPQEPRASRVTMPDTRIPLAADRRLFRDPLEPVPMLARRRAVPPPTAQAAPTRWRVACDNPR